MIVNALQIVQVILIPMIGKKVSIRAIQSDALECWCAPVSMLSSTEIKL